MEDEAAALAQAEANANADKSSLLSSARSVNKLFNQGSKGIRHWPIN